MIDLINTHLPCQAFWDLFGEVVDGSLWIALSQTPEGVVQQQGVSEAGSWSILPCSVGWQTKTRNGEKNHIQIGQELLHWNQRVEEEPVLSLFDLIWILFHFTGQCGWQASSWKIDVNSRINLGPRTCTGFHMLYIKMPACSGATRLALGMRSASFSRRFDVVVRGALKWMNQFLLLLCLMLCHSQHGQRPT